MVEDFLWLIVAKACLIRDAEFTVFNGEGFGSACILQQQAALSSNLGLGAPTKRSLAYTILY